MNFACLPGTEKYGNRQMANFCAYSTENAMAITHYWIIYKGSKIVKMKQQLSHLMTKACKVLIVRISQKNWDGEHEGSGCFSCTIPHYG